MEGGGREGQRGRNTRRRRGRTEETEETAEERTIISHGGTGLANELRGADGVRPGFCTAVIHHTSSSAMTLTEPQRAAAGGRGSPPGLKLDHGRCIVHLDIDCFYAQVEEVLDSSLRGKPIGIRQKYLLITCNYTARSLGVRKMESVVEAKKRCPSLVVMDGEDLTRYKEASEAIFRSVDPTLGACCCAVTTEGE